MALWVVRAGSSGEHEEKFLEDKRIYLTWGDLSRDLNQFNDFATFRSFMERDYHSPEESTHAVGHSAWQVWRFRDQIKAGDLVVLPGKINRSVVHLAEVTGGYTFVPDAENPYHHYRTVKWLLKSVPKSKFGQDLLYSFGSLLTIFAVTRNDAEQRVRILLDEKTQSGESATEPSAPADSPMEDSEAPIDLEQLARDRLVELIIARFKGHGMANLVDAVLRASGYTTRVSPPGPDGGADILAGTSPMGFGKPRICVQVKSGESPLERTVLDQLLGAMQKFKADQGLLVSWGGFRRTIHAEEASEFFRVRLWGQDELVDQVLLHYDQLDEKIKQKLPLKQIWVATEELE